MIGFQEGRPQARAALSIIDIGSNSIRLVVYEGLARAPTVLFNEKMLAGLGKGLVSTGRLDPAAVERAIEELRRFRALSRQAGGGTARVIATAAAREAENGPEFIRRAGEVLGTEIRVLSGPEEAHYSALGVVCAFHPADGIAGDLGGGSLELVDVAGRRIGEGITLPLGGLRLQDMATGSPAAASRIARAELARAALLKSGKGRAFYCVGGTWRNLARLHMSVHDYPLEVMHHYEMDPVELAPFLKLVMRGGLDRLPGIERISKSRRALLPYGAAVLYQILRRMRPSRVVASAFGVREGYLYSLLDEDERRADPLIAAADELAALHARSPEHARELARWSDDAFAAFAIEETGDEARYRHAACLLADIGWRGHPEYRGAQSLNVIAHASFIAIDHPGRAYIALASLFRHEGVFEETYAPELRALAGPRYIEHARMLGALLRLVDLLTASMPGLLPRLRWREGGDATLELVIPASHAALMGERPEGRMAHLSRLVGRPMRLVVGE